MMTFWGGLPRLIAQEEKAIRRRQTGGDLDVTPTPSSLFLTWTVPLSEQVRVALLNWCRSV